jgi:hypothetical protein
VRALIVGNRAGNGVIEIRGLGELLGGVDPRLLHKRIVVEQCPQRHKMLAPRPRIQERVEGPLTPLGRERLVPVQVSQRWNRLAHATSSTYHRAWPKHCRLLCLFRVI